jgi:hypothetical protein
VTPGLFGLGRQESDGLAQFAGSGGGLVSCASAVRANAVVAADAFPIPAM